MSNVLQGTIVNPDVIRGKSAYEIAVAHGFDGTEEEWLAYLKAEAIIDKEVSDRVEQAVVDVEKALSDANAAITTATEKANEASQYAADAEEAKDAALVAETNAQGFVESAAQHAEAAAQSVTNADASATRAEQAAARAEEAVDVNIVTNAISKHNENTGAHSDIRTLISNLDTKVQNLLDVDSETEEQLANLLKLIEENDGEIESLTDIADNMVDKTTYNTDKTNLQAQITTLETADTALGQRIDAIPSPADSVVLTKASTCAEASQAFTDHNSNGKRVYWEIGIVDEVTVAAVLIGYSVANKQMYFVDVVNKLFVTVDYSGADADLVVVTEEEVGEGGGDVDLSGVYGELADLTERVTTAEDTLTENGKADATLAQKVTQAENDIDAAEVEIAALKQAVAELNYTELAITSSAVSPNVAEVGTTVTELYFSWGLNKTPETLNFANGAETNVNARSKTLTGSFTKSTIGGSETFRLTVTETNPKGETVTDTRDMKLYFYNPIYYGVGSLASGFTSDFVKTLSKRVQNSKAYDFVATPNNQYVYYAVPTRLGKVSFKVNGFAGGFEEPVTVTVNNNKPESYYVYRSTELLTGTLPVDVT